MIKKVIIGIVVLCSLAWIGYYLLDIVDRKNSFKVEELFGVEDESILIVQRTTEYPLAKVSIEFKCPSQELLNELNDTLIDRIYISKQRNHLYVFNEKGWDINSVRSLFKKSKLLEGGGNEFTIGKYKGRFHRNGLYLFAGEFKYGNSYGKEFEHDEKSSASRLDFTAKGKYTITDIYYKGGGRFDYVQQSSKFKGTDQVDDVEKFAAFISSNITDYHFYERDYCAVIDEVYATGPMKSWNEKGFVVVTYEGVKAIISDYLPGQDPILVMQDAQDASSKSGYSVPLMKGFAQNEQYFLRYLEDVVVISTKSEVCDKIVADYKLGKVLSSDPAWMAKLTDILPRFVAERFVNDTQFISHAVYNGTLLTSRVNKEMHTEKTVSFESISLPIDGPVRSFKVLKGRGNIISLSTKGTVQYFKDGKELWRKTVPNAVNFEATDIYGDSRYYTICSSKDELYVFDENGNTLEGYPVKPDQDITTPVSFYSWKNAPYFLIGTGQKLVLYDAKGFLKKQFDLPINSIRKPDVWVSQSKLFFGASDNEQFVMINADKNAIYRQFASGLNAHPIEEPNQIFHYYLKGKTLNRVDQKGVSGQFGEFENGKIVEVLLKGSSTICVQTGENLKLVNTKGIPYADLKLGFSDIQSVDLISLPNGKTAVAVLDGLQNNVYLYGLDGGKIIDREIEGQQSVQLSISEEQLIITTIVDQFIVQYVEN